MATISTINISTNSSSHIISKYGLLGNSLDYGRISVSSVMPSSVTLGGINKKYTPAVVMTGSSFESLEVKNNAKLINDINVSFRAPSVSSVEYTSDSVVEQGGIKMSGMLGLISQVSSYSAIKMPERIVSAISKYSDLYSDDFCGSIYRGSPKNKLAYGTDYTDFQNTGLRAYVFKKAYPVIYAKNIAAYSSAVAFVRGVPIKMKKFTLSYSNNNSTTALFIFPEAVYNLYKSNMSGIIYMRINYVYSSPSFYYFSSNSPSKGDHAGTSFLNSLSV